VTAAETPDDPPTNRTAWRGPALLGALHAAVAIACRLTGRIRIEDDPTRGSWDWHWQTLPLADLRSDLLGGLWHLHAQPPGYNFIGGVLAKVLGDSQVPIALWILNVALGGLMVALAFDIVRGVTGGRRVAIVVGLVLALHPTLLLYEAYPLYTHLAATLCVAAVWTLHRFRATRRDRTLVGFAVLVVGLILVRSAFNLLLLVPLLVAIGLLCRDRRTLLIAGVLALLPLAWCVKNRSQFGFFGTSSWAGQGLWRVVAAGRSAEELHGLASAGVIEPGPSSVSAFAPPSRLREFGFERHHDVEVLSRDDHNNINVPAISASYMRSARSLIAYQPGAYLLNVERAYATFCEPSSHFKHVRGGRLGLGVHERVYSNGLYLASVVGPRRGSLLYFLIPGAVLIYLLAMVMTCRGDRRSWLVWIVADAPVVGALVLVAYTTLVGLRSSTERTPASRR